MSVVPSTSVWSGETLCFTNSHTLTSSGDATCAVNPCAGTSPAAGTYWRLTNVSWEVQVFGEVATLGDVQTYLYSFAAGLSNATALSDMTNSLTGFIGCCGNSVLTGVSDWSPKVKDTILVLPNQELWLAFLGTTSQDNYTAIVTMSFQEMIGAPQLIYTNNAA